MALEIRNILNTYSFVFRIEMSKNSLEDKGSTSAQATESTPLISKNVSFVICIFIRLIKYTSKHVQERLINV